MFLRHVAILGAAFGITLSSSYQISAQFSQAPDVPQSALNSPVLRPPTGAKVAIVEFDDMQCPLCAAWNPTLMQAAAKYHVPWVRHDFLIPSHPLSPQEAVTARWFDNKAEAVGAEYRNAVFAQQRGIETRENLQRCTETFAKQHGIQLPFVMDPQGKLMDAVKADCRLGLSLGVHETPTVYIVTANSSASGYSFARVRDLDLLSTYLDQAISTTTAKRKRAS